MTETLSIPLSKLFVWDGNVRKSGVDEGIEELAASIESHGLLQALIVRKAKSGKFAVIAGQRRLKALQMLASGDRMPADAPVRCELVSADADAGELSLAENIVRLAMHPADQFEAFRDLVNRGLDAAAVARRFGVSETAVLKRLKLGRLSPVVLDAYRNGDIDLEAAQAFAITDDQVAQERVLGDLPEWNRSPRMIRSQLTEDEVAASDKRVKFVGIDAYELAGGIVRRDLFDDSHSGTLLDPVLLDRLVEDNLASAAEAVRAEGWSWVDVMPSLDRALLSSFDCAEPEQIPLTEEQQAETEALSAEYHELADSAEADDGADAVLARLEAIESRLEEIEAARERFADDVLASAGAVVSIDWDGDIVVERGLLRREEIAEVETEPCRAPVTPAPVSIPATLVTDLTARRTAALQVAAVSKVPVMVAAVVHALAMPTFFPFSLERSCLKLSAEPARPERQIDMPDSCASVAIMAEAHEAWTARLPQDAADLWDWCLAQPQDVLLALLAHLGALSVDAIRQKADRADHGRFLHADALASAIGFDLADHYTPDAPTYFSRISSAQIAEALCEAKGVSPAPAWARMKKAELAALAAREVQGTRWLPNVMRPQRGQPLDEAA